MYVIPYPALLGLHLLAVAIFLAGLAITAMLLPSYSKAAPLAEDRLSELARLRSMNRAISTPALAFVWIFGGGMALEAGWYVTGWLQWKALLVLALSLLHLHQGRTLARLAAGRETGVIGFSRLATIAALIACIGTLVIAKPDLPGL